MFLTVSASLFKRLVTAIKNGSIYDESLDYWTVKSAVNHANSILKPSPVVGVVGHADLKNLSVQDLLDDVDAFKKAITEINTYYDNKCRETSKVTLTGKIAHSTNQSLYIDYGMPYYAIAYTDRMGVNPKKIEAQYGKDTLLRLTGFLSAFEFDHYRDSAFVIDSIELV